MRNDTYVKNVFIFILFKHAENLSSINQSSNLYLKKIMSECEQNFVILKMYLIVKVLSADTSNFDQIVVNL